MCQQIFGARFHLKDHLIKLSKDKKPRCTGLKKVIPDDVWDEEVLPYYTNDSQMPDLSTYANEFSSFGLSEATGALSQFLGWKRIKNASKLFKNSLKQSF